MIPYISLESVSLGPVSISVFNLTIVAAGVVGSLIALERAHSLGLSRGHVAILLAVVTLSALLGSRAFDLAFYQPETLRASPWTLLLFWKSFSSFGAVAGTLIGAAAGAAALRFGRADLTRFLDVVGYAFPFAWLPARLGCALVHDHPGIASDHWLAVDFPDGPRFDTGLLELLYLVPIALIFWVLGRRRRAPGLFLPLFFMLYGPGRFALDMLRVSDARYLSLTAAQYAAIAMTLAGASMMPSAGARGSNRANDVAS